MSSELTDLDAVRRFAVSVIDRSDVDGLEMRAITLALLGGIMWRSEPGSTGMSHDGDGSNAVLTTTLGDRHLTFSYDHQTEAIEMREGTTDGPVLHCLCNRTLVRDFERTLRALWETAGPDQAAAGSSSRFVGSDMSTRRPSGSQ